MSKHLKTIQLTPAIAPHDEATKLKQARQFLKDKKQVQLRMLFKGRMITKVELGAYIMDRFVYELLDVGRPASTPKLDGRFLRVTINPKK